METRARLTNLELGPNRLLWKTHAKMAKHIKLHHPELQHHVRKDRVKYYLHLTERFCCKKCDFHHTYGERDCGCRKHGFEKQLEAITNARPQLSPIIENWSWEESHPEFVAKEKTDNWEILFEAEIEKQRQRKRHKPGCKDMMLPQAVPKELDMQKCVREYFQPGYGHSPVS
jgi:hypothetical protein